MNTIKVLLFLVCLTFGHQAQDQTSGWHGIVPLRSTRQDVERLLRPSREGCHCTYRLGDERIFVQYSEEPCSDPRDPGWKVPKDTVINISVYPKANLRFSELKIDPAKFVKTADPEIKGVFYYFNENDGTTIVVDGEVISEFGYGPTKRDDDIRCPSKKKPG